MTSVPETTAIKWGRDNEENAIKDLERKLGGKVNKCGLFISKLHPFIGASPDGLFEDCVVEIKCPFVLRDHKPAEISKLTKEQQRNFCCHISSEGFKLKQNHGI